MSYLLKFLKLCLLVLFLSSGKLHAAHGTVQGVVSDVSTGNPISGATVSFYRVGGILEYTTTTDANGFYTYSNDPHNYYMTVDATGYQQAVIGFKLLSNDTVTIDVPMTGGPGEITGNIQGTTPGTVTTVDLYLNNVLIGTTQVTGANSFSFPGLTSGTYVLVASASGYGSVQQSVTVTAPATTNVTITLSLISTTLNGNVSNGSTGINGASVQVYQNNVLVTQTLTDASGNYTISGLSLGDYIVQASAQSYSLSAQGVSITAPGTYTCNFTLTQDPGLLEGFILDNQGQPIQSALVQVLQNNIPVFTVYSGVNGSYFVNRLAPGSYTVIASKANYQTLAKGAIISAGQTTLLNFNLIPNPGSISGNVKSSGSNLAGVLVEVNQNNVVLFTTLTNANGNYSFPSLAPGSYVIHAHIAGYQSGSQGAIVVSNANTIVNFDLALNPGTLTGNVKSGGVNLVGALVEVNLNNVVLFSTLTDASGNYTIDSIAPGTYIIHAHDPGYQSGITGITIASGSNILDFVLDPDPGTLKGQVTSNGQTLSGVLVEVNYANIVLFTTLTNGSGYYQIEGIAPGTYSIHAHFNNYQNGVQEGVSILSDNVTTVNFALQPNPASVKGTVQGPGSTALVGASVEMNVNNVVVDSALTDANGQYSLTNQAAGNYVMHAHAQGFATGVVPITLDPGDSKVQNFVLSLATNTLGGKAFNNITMQPISGAFIELYIQGSSFDYIDTVATDSLGVYNFENLAGATYRIIAKASGYEPAILDNPTLNSNMNNIFMTPLPPAPSVFSGEVVLNRFLMRADRIHKLQWTQSQSSNLSGYKIYRNGEFLKFIPKNEPLIYLDHNKSYNQTDVYLISSVSLNGYEGGSDTVTLR